MKTANFVIDNMPLNASPVYDCNVDTKPLVFKPGNMYGNLVAGRKRNDKRRYTVPLYPITNKTFIQISAFMIRNAATNDYWDGGAVLCLRGNKIGLAFHNSAVKKREHNEE